MKRLILALAAVLLLGSIQVKNQEVQSSNDQSKPGIAKVIIDKGLTRINSDIRKSVIAEINSIDEEYVSKQALLEGRSKSREENKKTIIGRPKLDRMNIDDLYKAFSTRYDFFIDNDHSIEAIGGVSYAVIQYKPKLNLSTNTVTDSFINRTAGKVYINMDNYEIMRITGGINDHFVAVWHAWWSPISIDIDVYEFNFSIDYTLFNDIVIEKDLTGMVDYEIRHRGVEKHSYSLSNYRIRNR